MAACEIEWNSISIAQWDEMFADIRRSTLLQHYPYAQALRATQQLGARHGIIYLRGEQAGLVQIGEVGLLCNAVHAVTLDRGPLWFDGFRHRDSWESFIGEFCRQFPSRFGRKRRILPEFEKHELSEKSLENLGLKSNPRAAHYETSWLDLDESQDALRTRMKGNWRNTLSKSERSNLVIECDTGLAAIDQLLMQYEADKREKGFSGPPARLMSAIISFMAVRDEVLLLHAEVDDAIVASILVLIHGRSATYQLGHTSSLGRKLGAHHGLLWRAILELKARGIRDFDLGGLNEETAAGVSKFKAGLGGRRVTLAGMFH